MEIMSVAMILAFCWGYGLGSIPFGLISGLLFGLGDIRQIGSGNIGATNVLRTGNKKAAFVTLILDGIKGAVAVGIMAFLTRALPHENRLIILLMTGAFAFVGHLFPVWLKFKGGKGVATFLGLQFALNGFSLGLASCVFWVVGWKASGISSVGALTTAVLTSALLWGLALCQISWLYPVMPVEAFVHTGLASLLILRHHQNISRLLKGTEPKSGSTPTHSKTTKQD